MSSGSRQTSALAAAEIPSDERVVQVARRLVDAPSPNPPGDERAVAAVATEALAELGLSTPHVLARSDARPNLLTTLDFGAG